ncbi:hypothetical protein M2271_003849 [Streptomyces sp. LBL]|nr:hypothetical protein [Streptomyces sp. LBL]
MSTPPPPRALPADTHTAGRTVGVVFPTTVGSLADSRGVSGALVFGATTGLRIGALALPGLSETRGKELA